MAANLRFAMVFCGIKKSDLGEPIFLQVIKIKRNSLLPCLILKPIQDSP
jgi:hypothetical protein